MTTRARDNKKLLEPEASNQQSKKRKRAQIEKPLELEQKLLRMDSVQGLAEQISPSIGPYQYRSLDGYEIRLLEIVKSPSDDHKIEYRIVHKPLDNAPPYETVSYVWGEKVPSSSITLIDGSSLPVTAALAKFLPLIVKYCTTGYLWIDQLTINQSNTNERNAQVKIMGEIYRRCTRCLIWLGRELRGAETEDQVDWTQRQEVIKEFFESFSVEPSTRPELRRRSSPVLSRDGLMRRLTSDDQDLLWFFEHPWFKRTWVYQEFVLSPKATFLLGDLEIPGEGLEEIFKGGWARGSTLSNTFDQLLIPRLTSKTLAALFHQSPAVTFLIAAVEIQFRLPYLRQSLDDPRVPFGHQGAGFPAYQSHAFLNALENMGASIAHDDHDHVYAFIGLAPFLLRHMQVDYSLRVEEAFAGMMKAIVKESKCLDFFCNLLCESDISRSKLRLPSWVPNWTFFTPYSPILTHDNHFMASGKYFGAPKITACTHEDPEGGPWNELQVAGKIIDTISFILRPYSPYQVRPSREIDFKNDPGFLPWDRETWTIFMDEMSERSLEAAENVSVQDLLRTLFMDGVQWSSIDALNALHETGEDLYREDIKDYGEGQKHGDKAKDLISKLTEGNEPDLSSLPHRANLLVLHELSRVQYRRRVAYCTNRKLALAPDLVEKGDLITILHGSRTPVVLRARPDGKYVVVGQCYYDGAMYGELADSDDAAASIFTLV